MHFTFVYKLNPISYTKPNPFRIQTQSGFVYDIYRFSKPLRITRSLYPSNITL